MGNEKLDIRPVRVILDSDGYLISAGDPSWISQHIKKQIIDALKNGGRVKVVPYHEYLSLKCIYDKPFVK